MAVVAHEMTGRTEYLAGSTKQLATVWKPYGIEVQTARDGVARHELAAT